MLSTETETLSLSLIYTDGGVAFKARVDGGMGATGIVSYNLGMQFRLL